MFTEDAVERSSTVANHVAAHISTFYQRYMYQITRCAAMLSINRNSVLGGEHSRHQRLH